MIEQARNLGEHHTDVLGTLWHLNAHQFFDGQAVSVLVGHHGHIVQAVHVRQGLNVGFGFGQLFGGTVQQTNVRIGTLHNLAIELEHQAQNAVGRRVLRSKVQGVVFNFCHVD